MATTRKSAEVHPIATTSSQSSIEATPEKPLARTVDLDRVGETDGYILNEAQLKQQLGLSPGATLKKSRDGQTVLIPQPSDDADDPLNWSTFKKSMVLLVICIVSCCGDYGSATGATALLPQAQEWHLSPNTVNHATAGNVFMIGAGGLVVVWLSACFGRLPVLLYFELLALGTVIWCAAATTFESYMAARILNGFFGSVAAVGGLMFIKDIFFFHQHPRAINIWATAMILSPFLGPMFMALIISVTTWRVGFWLIVGLAGLALILTVLFLDEPFYPRHLMPDRIPARRSRWMRLTGLEQFRTNYTGCTLVGAAARPALTIRKLPVLLSCIYLFFTFAWVIGNNTTISVFIVPEYNFTYKELAAIYVAPVVGATIGLVVGHWLHDFIGALYAKRHNGVIVPEARLIILWFMTPLTILGLVLIGTTLTQHWSYWVLAIGWAIHNFATIVTTTAINVYCLDAYPEASGEVSAWLNTARTSGGFAVGYVQIIWAQAQGTQTEFGIQAAIVAGVFSIIIFLQFYGAKLRHKQGPLHFKTY